MSTSDLLPMSHARYNEQLYRSAIFSDCTIKCQSRLWHLHRAILSPRCEFFWKCFDGPFEESSAVIEMHDDDPDTLERMLRWIYTLEWSELKESSDVWTSDLALYMLADKYGLSALMNQARDAILCKAQKGSSLSRSPDNDYFIQYIDDFVDMMEWLFDDPPDRDDIHKLQSDLLLISGPMIAKHIRTQSQLQELLSNTPAFGLHLVEALAKGGDISRRRRSSHTLATPILPMHDEGAGSSNSSSGRSSPRKVHIPLNEDSEDEFD